MKASQTASRVKVKMIDFHCLITATSIFINGDN